MYVYRAYCYVHKVRLCYIPISDVNAHSRKEAKKLQTKKKNNGFLSEKEEKELAIWSRKCTDKSHFHSNAELATRVQTGINTCFSSACTCYVPRNYPGMKFFVVMYHRLCYRER